VVDSSGSWPGVGVGVEPLTVEEEAAAALILRSLGLRCVSERRGMEKSSGERVRVFDAWESYVWKFGG